VIKQSDISIGGDRVFILQWFPALAALDRVVPTGACGLAAFAREAAGKAEETDMQATKVPRVEASGVVIRPLPAVAGAEVDCGDLKTLNEEQKESVHRAWLDHLFLIFHGQELTDNDLAAVSHIFGEPEIASVAPKDGLYQQIAIVSNVVQNGKPLGVLGAGELLWHSDHSFNERPLGAALLYALEVPAEGGNTWFSNMYLALETLPAKLRQRIEGLTIKNDGSHNSAGERRTDVVITDVRTYEGPSHPIVRTHPETGYNCLYLGRRPNAYVNGLSIDESEALLNELWTHASEKRFAWSHKWAVGDLVVWDNRCCMHRRDAFDSRERRVMHRAQCAGDRPVYRLEAAKRGPHPRAYLKSSPGR
jgi:taurine dioxygenase